MSEINVKSVILGEPASPYHQIDPVLLTRMLEQIEISASLTGSMYFEDTLVDLNAVAGVVNGDTGFVLVDPNSGVYRRVAGAWNKTSNLPAGFSTALTGKSGFAILRQTFLPGDVPQNFTSTLVGEAEDAAMVPGAIVADPTLGNVLRLTGAAVVGIRERIRIDAARRYQLSWQVRRQTNPTDPAGDTVRLGVYWLNGSKQLLAGGNQVVQDITLTTSMGLVSLDRFAFVGATGTNLAPPAGAVYMVPYVQTFGLNGVTDVVKLGWVETQTVARTFYVTMDGVDTNAGTSLSSPLGTVGEALAKMALEAPSPCVTIVHPGDYLVRPDTVIPADCAIYGYDLRVTKLRLSNAAGTAAATGAERQNNMFLMNSGIKIRGFTFTGMTHNAYTLAGGPPTKGYATAFNPGATIIRSPYISDCSMLHDFTQDQMTLPINKATGNPLMPVGAGNLLADGSVLDLDSPLRSVVVDSFTSINPNGVGYAITRNAFVQLVSVFTNWSRVGLWAHDGGQVTVANSNNTFGDYAFASTGFRNTIRIPGVADPATIAAYPASADIISAQLEAIVTNLMTVRYPTLIGWSGLTADQRALTERDTRTLLRYIMNDLRSGQDKGAQLFTKGLFNWNAQYAFATSLLSLFTSSWEQVRLELLARLTDAAAETMVTSLITMITAVVTTPATYRVGFPSVIEANAQQFSNAGSGVNYNSLPFSQRGTGENPDPTEAIYKLNGGKVYATFSTEVGDTYLGEDLRVDFERNTIEGQAFSRGVQNIALPLIIGIGG